MALLVFKTSAPVMNRWAGSIPVRLRNYIDVILQPLGLGLRLHVNSAFRPEMYICDRIPVLRAVLTHAFKRLALPD